MIEVSIVIVCMNNLKNLYPCLNSIRKYTTVAYETFVVAYLFSKENLEKVKQDFPWVTFIESNEIRGFSENNNLALRQAKGKYCFVVNDDTEMKMSVIDRLVEDFSVLPENVAIVSPKLIHSDGSDQVCGVPPISFKTVILEKLHLWNRKKQIHFVNQTGLFKSYNIIGAAFLIKRDIFESVDWFDERYFFCPEDIALSTLLNNKGYACYVDGNAKIIHYEGMSGKSLSLIQTATKPAARRGSIIFLSKGNKTYAVCIEIVLTFFTIISFLIHCTQSLFSKRPNQFSILALGEWNTIITSFSSKSPKEIFTQFYSKIKK